MIPIVILAAELLEKCFPVVFSDANLATDHVCK